MKIEDAVRKSGGVWPKRLLSKGSIGAMLWLDSDGGITVCTRSDFEECARRLRNEPSWDDAPDWAIAKAQDSDGEWYWHITEPVPCKHSWCDDLEGKSQYAGKGEVLGDWERTVRLRPEEEKMEDKNVWLRNVRDAFTKNAEEFDSLLMSVLNRIESHEKLEESEPTGDWHAKGEFPPVGTVCEVLPWWYVCESIAPHRDGMVMYNRYDDAYFLATKNHRFRPPPTERDRWIEMAANIDIASPPHPETWPDILARIYDAGLAKMPEDK